MKKSFNFMMRLVIAIALPLYLTSCEDILGEWSKPTHTPVTPSTPETPTESDKYNVYAWYATEKIAKATPTDIPTTGVTTETELTNTWSGTIVVGADKILTGNVTLSSDVKLIIKDGVELKINNGQILGGGATNDDYSLNIYGQTESTGKLTIDANNENYNISAKNIEIHGCVLSAIKSTQAIKIGDGGYINIYNGNVTATGKTAGVRGGATGNINIYGGKLTATSTNGNDVDGSGIKGDNFTMYDGMVITTGSDVVTTRDGFPGIEVAVFSMEGGNLTARGGNGMVGSANGGAGIGATTSITINGGTVTAIGSDAIGDGCGGNGIGNAYGPVIPVKITNCTRVTATGGIKASGTSTNGFSITGNVNVGTSLKYSVDDGTSWTNGTVADLAPSIHQSNRSIIIIPQ